MQITYQIIQKYQYKTSMIQLHLSKVNLQNFVTDGVDGEIRREKN